MAAIAEEIMSVAELGAEGEVLSAKGLLHLGSRAGVDQALSRLCKNGQLLRVGRGHYVRPVQSQYGTRAPRPERVVESLAAVTGEMVAPNGAASANALGLTTQMPIRAVFLTSGRTRRFQLGKQVVELKHAPNWQLREPKKPSGEAVRAIAWLGQERASEAIIRLKTQLPQAAKKALLAARSQLPSWLAAAVSQGLKAEAGSKMANA